MWQDRWKEFTGKGIVAEFLATFNPDEPGYYRVKALYEQIENYFDGNVPEEIKEQFVQDYKRDFILENLQTHHWRQLYNRLCDKFGCNIDIDYMSHGPAKEQYLVLNFPRPLTDEEKELCKKIAKFYRYTVNFSGSTVKLEPEFAERVNMDGKLGVAYHIVNLFGESDEEKERILSSIQRNGLRPRNGHLPLIKNKKGERVSRTYRKFPPRIYVCWLDDYLAKTDEGRREQFQPILDMWAIDWEDCAVFAVDTGHLNANFYRDTVAAATDGIQTAAYTYQNIPANRLSRIH